MTRGIRTLLGAAIVLWGVAAPAGAQPSGAIRGVVHDHTGRPAPGVVITIAHPEQTAVRVALTDLHGEYEVHGLEADTRYRVQASHPHFRKARLEARGGEDLTVRLKPRRACLMRAPDADRPPPDPPR